MAEGDSSNSFNDVPQNLLAELRALRDQVQSQHGLITALTGRRANREAGTPIRELNEPLAPHASRAADSEPVRFPASEDLKAPSRPGPAGKAWWPMPAATATPLHPVPGWALYGQQGTVKAVGFSVLGLDEAATREAVDFVARAQRNQRNFVPVFLTDLDELQVFRDHGFVAEYLAGASIEPAAARQRYLAERKDLIQRKWNLGAILDMTRSARPDLGAAGFGALESLTTDSPATDTAAPTQPAEADADEDAGPIAARTP